MKKHLAFYVLVVIILSLLIGAYSNHFNNPFEFDDGHTIVNNNAIRSLRNIPQFFKDARTFSTLPANQSYRPGVTTLNAIDYWIGGKQEPEPFYFHVSIFISYLFLGTLLYFLFLKLFQQTIEHKWNKYIALFGAGFFCLHTANAETINYIIARSDSFSTLMIVLSFVIFLYKPNWRNKFIYLIPVMIGFFVKEPTIMIAPILFVYILLFDKNIYIIDWFSKKEFKEFISSGISLLPLFILIFLLFALSKIMTPATFFPSTTPRLYYILTQPFVILHYFNNFILPLSLSADTDWIPITTIFDYRVLIGILFIICLIAVSIYCSTKPLLRPVSFGIIWFLLALLPTSLTSLAEILNDHRTFFPYIGLVIASTWLFGLLVFRLQKQIESNSALKFGFLFILLFILSAHAYGVRQRNKVWSSAESLWYDVTIKSPNNARGLMNYGVAKMAKGDYATTLTYFEKALKIYPNYSTLYTNIAIVKAAMGNNNEVEVNYKKALVLNSNNPETYFFYSTWLKSQKHYKEALDIVTNGLLISKEHRGNKILRDEIIKLIANEGNALLGAEQQAARFPSAPNYLNLSLIYYQNGYFEKSIIAANNAIQLKPDYAKAYNNICSAQNMLGNYDEAIKAGEQALKINPNYQLAKNNLADGLSKKEKVDKVFLLIKKDPSEANYINLSLVYYQLGSFQKCMDAAEHALKANPNSETAYNNICSAYNMLKLWDKAIEAGEKGLKINPNNQLLKNNLEVSKKGNAENVFSQH